MRHTYLIYVLSVVMYVAALGSCAMAGEESFADDREPAIGEMVEISLGVPSLSTRTSIEGDNGKELTARWDAGDSFGLLVRRSESSTVAMDENLFGNAFSFTHAGNDHDLKNELFTGRMPHIPQDYTYNYYAIYPYSAITGVNDTTVSCTIPTVQSGVYDGGADLMFASVQGDALDPNLYNNLDFEFKHLTHALKITVPEELNEFGYDIERIAIEFPQPVAGEAVLDYTTGKLDVSTLKSDIIEIRFSKENPFEAGIPFWVYTAPVELDGAVRFTAYNDTEGAMSDYVQTTELTKLEPKHITPISLKVQKGYQVTWFEYEIFDESSRLGEELETLNLTLPEGLRTASNESNVVKLTKDVVDNKYRIAFHTDELEAKINELGSVDFQPKYESEHALLSPYDSDLEKFVISSEKYTSDNHNYSYTIDNVPYLFEEDFSNFDNFSADDNYSGGFNTGAKNASSMKYIDGTATGWTGARCGASRGLGVRLASRREAIGLSASYPARMDSAPISNLKQGVAITLKLTFDYGANYQGTRVTNTIKIGRVENSSGFSSNATDGTFDPTNSFVVDDDTGNYDNLTNLNQSFILTECVPQSRITWIATATNQMGASNTTCWLYIDNVKVSIAQ